MKKLSSNRKIIFNLLGITSFAMLTTLSTLILSSCKANSASNDNSATDSENNETYKTPKLHAYNAETEFQRIIFEGKDETINTGVSNNINVDADNNKINIILKPENNRSKISFNYNIKPDAPFEIANLFFYDHNDIFQVNDHIVLNYAQNQWEEDKDDKGNVISLTSPILNDGEETKQDLIINFTKKDNDKIKASLKIELIVKK